MILYVDRNKLPELPEYGFLLEYGSDKDRGAKIRQAIYKNIKYGVRDNLENDPTKKQIIPYFIISRTNDDRHQFFTYERLAGQSEERLHNQRSIGFGGHIEIEDGIGDPLFNGLMRELNEELFAPNIIAANYCGIVNDDRNEVGNVHLGLVYSVRVEGDVKVREVDKIEGRWENLEDINRDELETWSQIFYDAIFR